MRLFRKGTTTATVFNDVVFTNTGVNGLQKGLEVISGKNVTIENNFIENIRHNAFSIYGEGYDFSGNIIVRNNIITYGGHRAIKFSDGANATILVENNTIYDAYKFVAYI